MIELQRTDSVASETVVLVGVLLNGRSTEEHPLEELEGLATTAGARVVGQLTQRREAPDVTTYLGQRQSRRACSGLPPPPMPTW